jgi:hypothetical protein
MSIMLKLTYLDNGFNLEYLHESLENWLNTRVMLALHSRTNIYVENITASFLVKASTIPLTDLMNLKQETNIVELCPCDADLLEVTFKGVWLTSHFDKNSGVFVTGLSKYAEVIFSKLNDNKQFCYK